MTIPECIEQRRSIRKYTDQEVEKEKIEEVLRAALLAPSGKNRQPWKYLVYQGEEKEKLLDKMEKGLNREKQGEALLPESRHGLPSAFHTLRIMRQAPVLIIVLNTNAKSPFEEIGTEKRFSEICDSLSIGASIQNMLLRATELGLGSLWIGNTCFAYTEIVDYLKTEDQLAGAVSLGYADESPAARPRKKWEEVVQFIE
ncbi:MAG: nitroreductase family protein [Eubacterium sp.]|nr:nitroreductase family protein [Eubacterium sp.]